jgi:ribonucleotide reductase alpha subunit
MSKKKKKTAVELSPNAVTVLERRYLRRDNEGKTLEAPFDMFERLSADNDQPGVHAELANAYERRS